MSDAFERRVRATLAAWDQRGLTRHPPALCRRQGTSYELQGRRVLGFCSNDYLGLAQHPSLSEAAALVSAGATASRLVCGDLPLHRAVEHALADWAETADAVLFPSGYQLNVGVLPALLGPDDRVHSDALNHASLVDGLRLARTSREIVPHLQAPADPEPHGDASCWWITESVFSMDGDHPEPRRLHDHLARGGCLYLDEAHATGLYEQGVGFAAAHGLRPTVLVGTLGKALGCAGAFVAASAEVCRLVRGSARSFVYSTAIAPPVAAAAQRAIALVRGPEGTERRTRLWARARRLAEALDLPPPSSPIFPFVVGDNDLALRAASELLAAGFHVQPIRPPTVPVGTARLRVTISAEHTTAEIDLLASAVAEVLARAGLSPERAFAGRAA